MSLPFVHTARRSYRLDKLVIRLDNEIFKKNNTKIKYLQIRLFRGRRSRNKVSVGEPAEGSLKTILNYCVN